MKFLLTNLLLATCYLLLVTSASAHSTVQVIKMTPQNFEPNNVAVDENSTVLFVNQDQVPRWPASNLHPTHELYPEFDPKKAISPGESWSFKTKKAGIWRYHDHLNPHLRGTIVVTPENEGKANATPYPSDILGNIRNFFSSLTQKLSLLFRKEKTAMPEDFKKQGADKQFQTLTGFAKSKGADMAWSYLEEAFKEEAGSSGNIHDLAHLLGKLIYEEKGISGIGVCKPNFAFGCYHGLLDAAFKTNLDDLPIAEKGCEKLGPVNSGPYGSCIHGIGHGIASFHQTQNLEKALESCNRLSLGQDFCYDGVFMEFARNAPPSFYSKEDPLYPCSYLENKYATHYSLACGRNQPTVLISRLELKFEDATRLCSNNTLSDQYKSACFEALGFMLASTQDTTSIISGCKSVTNSRYSSLCLKSAAGELVFQNVPGWEEKSKEICESAPGSSKASCLENLQKIIKEYGRTPQKGFDLLRKGQDEQEYTRAQMNICYGTGGKDNCYKEAADILSKQFGLKKTLAIFAKNEEHPEIYSRCHEVTHYLSRSEYQKTKSVAQVYAQCDSTCHGGCYHGVLEQYLKEKDVGNDDTLAQELTKICGQIQDFNKPLVFNECLHGLGHAAMFVTDMEVPESLALCDKLDSQDGRERCYGGVFMENSSSSTNNDHPGKYIKADDPLYPCDWLPEKYSKLCYRYQSSYFALITNHNWQETVRLCLSVPGLYQSECFRTIGTNQVGFTQDTNLMFKNCALPPSPNFQKICLQGVVSSFSYRFVGDIKRMEDFCSKAPDNHQKACFSQIGTSLTDWVTDKKEALRFCDKILNSRFSGWCKAAVSG